MSVFQHPHLTRGIVQTAKGAFAITRGLVEMPDDLGNALGWRRVECDDDRVADAGLARPHASQQVEPAEAERRARA
jgi:hypothetical protein